MTEEQKPQIEQKSQITPSSFLAGLVGAPSEARIAEIKAQAPGGRVAVFSPDGKRAFVYRGYTGFEADAFQKAIPANASDQEGEFRLQVVQRCVVWTNVSPDGALDVLKLKTLGAGLVPSLFQLISQLSDFFDPAELAMMAGEL